MGLYTEYQYVWVPTFVGGGHLSTMATGHGGTAFIAGCLVNHGDGFFPLWQMGYTSNHGGPGYLLLVRASFGIREQWHGTLAQVMFRGSLAPGEIYYGRRDYGPQSVNINQVNINIQKNVYSNARVKDAVVTVQKDSFSKEI